jgi:tetratricopeptide (TPR) repeat protein/predicted Ser/Thr protein kinase
MDPLEAFFEQYERDVGAGAPQSLEDYQALWPEQAEVIAEVFGDLRNLPSRDSGLRELLDRVVGGGGEGDTVEERPGSHAGGLAGEWIGPYRILSLLGAGGMGEVYLAEQDRPRRVVALKVLRRELMQDGTLRRFDQEAELLGRLRHPGIAQVYEAGRAAMPWGSFPYIAMQYVEGEPLAARIDRLSKSSRDTQPRTRRDVMNVVVLVAQVARALDAAHEAGVIHRDVKPGNIMVTPAGDPVILDFGIARDMAGDLPTLTREGAAPGTPYYMSPEQFRGEPVDHRTDVWSLGVTLHECVTGRRPFPAATYDDLREAVLRQDPPRASRRSRSLPWDLEVVIHTALEKDRDRRYQSARALAEDLEAVVNGHPIVARSVSLAGRVLRWARREPAKATLLIVLLIAIPTVASLTTAFLSTRGDVREAQNRRERERVERALEQAWFHLGEFDHAEAVERFEAVLWDHPEIVEARAGLAFAWLARDDVGRALEAVRRHPTSELPLRRIEVEALRRQGNVAASGALAQDLDDPKTPVDLFVAGWLAFASAREDPSPEHPGYREAVRWLSLAVMSTPSARSLYHFDLAYAVGRTRDRALAEKVAQALITLWPDSGYAHFRAGYALARAEADPDLAVRSFREACRRLPELPSAHANLANCLQRAGDPVGAAAAAREALRLRPEFWPAWNELGIAEWRLGRLDEAADACRRAVDGSGGNAEFRNNYGLVLLDQGRLDEAREIFEAIIRAHPEIAHAHANLGLTLMRKVDMDGAIEHLRSALNLYPDFPEGWSNLGLCLQHKGAHAEAVGAFRKALEAAPWMQGPRSNLGNLLRDLGKVDEAVEVLTEEVRRFPDHAQALCNLGHALVRQGRPREALVHFEKGHEIGRRQPGWRYPSDRWLTSCRARVATEDELDAIIEGADLGSDGTRAVSLARAAQARRSYPLALRLWRHAFALDQDLAGDLRGNHRYNAACAAARVAEAGGSDDERLDLRTLALGWLEADLAAWTDRFDRGRVRTEALERTLLHWLADEDLRSLREEDVLASLSDAEAGRCRVLWSAVQDVLRRLD